MDKIYGPFFNEKELGLDKIGVTQVMREKMYLLVAYGLNAIREKWGPVTITSGVRTTQEQAMLTAKGYKPSPTSQHLSGEAVDFVCKGRDMQAVFAWIRDTLKWPGQVFYYKKKGHVHIALPNIQLKFAGRLYAQELDQ
jgi:uncharacterized protein YcbK (DUF882 family)